MSPSGPPPHPGGLSDYAFTFESIPDRRSSSNLSSTLEPDPNPGVDEYSESITESIANFPERFGRTYHAYQDGSYVFPNDFPERERLELQGLVMTELFGGRWYLAPVDEEGEPGRILDVGTGTGIWALEMGDRFPSSRVYGIDLSPIQPTAVPSNVHFFVQDASEPWDWNDPLDFVFCRSPLGSFRDIKADVIGQAYDSLRPGGWFEIQDFNCEIWSDDGTLSQDGALARWTREMNAASDTMGRPLSIAHKLRGWCVEAGFVDVRERVFKIPMNGWAKDPRLKALGRLWETNFLDGLSGFTLSLFSQVLEKKIEEIEIDLVNVRKETSDPYIHSYMKIFVAYGRKPYPHEMAT